MYGSKVIDFFLLQGLLDGPAHHIRKLGPRDRPHLRGFHLQGGEELLQPVATFFRSIASTTITGKRGNLTMAADDTKRTLRGTIRATLFLAVLRPLESTRHKENYRYLRKL